MAGPVCIAGLRLGVGAGLPVQLLQRAERGGRHEPHRGGAAAHAGVGVPQPAHVLPAERVAAAGLSVGLDVVGEIK